MKWIWSGYNYNKYIWLVIRVEMSLNTKPDGYGGYENFTMWMVNRWWQVTSEYENFKLI